MENDLTAFPIVASFNVPQSTRFPLVVGDNVHISSLALHSSDSLHLHVRWVNPLLQNARAGASLMFQEDFISDS